MIGERAAIRYAKAILEVANSKNAAKEVSNDMNLITSTVTNNEELNAFIQNPTISVEIKQNALLEVFSTINPVTKNLFQLLFVNKRFEILEAIATKYNHLFDEMNGIETAKVITAIPMDATLEAKIMEKIATFSNKKITIENTVNPDIIGGFILRIGDQQYNASVANRLQELKREFTN